MFARIAAAAFATIVATTPALAANTDSQITFRLDRHADAAAAMERITYKANDACRFGAFLADKACVEAFVAEAVSTVKDPSLRAELMGTTDVAMGGSTSRATRN